MVGNGSHSSGYLERYQDGQYREVWDELLQLGQAVFEEPLYTEAMAVARTMMRRVRVNIETLISRLLQIHFVFGYDHRLQEQLALALTSAHARRQYQEMRAWANEQPLVFWPTRQQEEERAETQQLLAQDASLALFLEEEQGEESHSKQRSDTLEHLASHIPLALHAWFEEIEAVNFFGYHSQWEQLAHSFHESAPTSYLMSSADPFQVRALDEQQWQQVKNNLLKKQSYQFEFAPDRHFKDYYGGTSTPYTLAFPQASVDAIMPTSYGTKTFVEYLRVSLSWAGFPGMMKWPKVPHDDLLFLTGDLLPF